MIEIFKTDMTHVHHKFLDLGFHHRLTVIIMYSISFFGAVFALLFRRLLAAILLVLKVVFKEEQELFLTTPLDFLILTLSVSFALITPELDMV